MVLPRGVLPRVIAPQPKHLTRTPRNVRTLQDMYLSQDVRHRFKRPALLKEAALDFRSRAADNSIALHALELR